MRRQSIKRPVEITDVGADFTRLLATGETITSVELAEVSVVWGTDPAPSAMLSGSASLVGNVVGQRITGGLAGVDYRIEFTVNTSAGQKLTDDVVVPVRAS